MKNLVKNVALALTGVALFTACSRPYATYQPSASARIATQEVSAVAVAPTHAPVLAPTLAEPTAAATVNPTATALRTQLAEAVASNKTAVADKRVQQRLARIDRVLAVAEKSAVAPVASSRKLTLTERMMLKKVSKKINRTLSPEEAKATPSNTRLGLIIGVVGLLFILVGGIAGSGVIVLLGLLGLIIGLVLLLLGLANNG
jgi:hypothetical protein